MFQLLQRSHRLLASIVLVAPAVAQLPNAVDDTAAVCPGAAVDVDILANDSSATPLVCGATTIVVPPAVGTAVVLTSGACGSPLCPGVCLRYTAPPGSGGTVTLVYRIQNASGTDPAVVTVNVGQPGAGCGPGKMTTTQTFSDCHGCPLGSTVGFWSTPAVPRLQIPKVALGPGQELVEVRAETRLRSLATVRVENQGPTNCICTVDAPMSLSACATVTPPGACASSGLCSNRTVTPSHTFFLGPYDGSLDFDGPSGDTVNLSPADTTSAAIFSSAATLAHFTDANPTDGITEFVEVDHAASGSIVATGGCSPFNMFSESFGAVEITVVYTLCNIGVPYCPGDGTGAGCPCGNTSPIGAGLGCRNSTNVGGELRATGVASIANDTLTLTARNLTGSSALFVQADTQDNGGLGTWLGDGLRCINGSIIRLLTNPATAGSSSYPMPGNLLISVRGAVTVPGARYYQVHYRNAAAFCTPATFNLTNGLWIQWQP